MENNKTLVIVEDDVKIANILIKYAEASGFNCHHINDGALAVDWVKQHRPEAMLLDIMLPNLDGIEICQQVRQFSNLPILMITAKVEEVDRLLGLDIGADDYICKPFSPKEVMARIKVILRRLTPPVPTKLIAIDAEAQTAALNGHRLSLTPVEFRILAAFCGHANKAWNREQLINKMYDDYREVSDRTVDSHVANLRKKLLELLPQHDFIQSVYGVGYRWQWPQ
ncbi:response regulator [Paraferrimonas sp. SM1919]|uniref:response regulator n=1 Tax=Paraferrimonas sp. SM1919 TaxID=2662263 RepID=UPI0013D4F68C|nr:response regulator [Paraferrimonas sp. SM1919]